MKMSTKCRYGLRALADLALYGKEAPVPLHQIAQRQNLSIKYLEQEFATLRKAGFVRSVKGAQGGYIIARPPSEICVAEVIRHLEGDLLLIGKPAQHETATPLRMCLYDSLWQPLNEQVEQRMKNIFLSDLVDMLMSGSEGEPMYYI
jgi:Rrf2 family protein